MLILTRRIGESVKIDGDITVTILGTKGNQVRLGMTLLKVSVCIVKRFMNAYKMKRRKKKSKYR